MVKKKQCDKCNRMISLSNFNGHSIACKGILEKKPRKIVHVDYNPNAGYKDGTRIAWNKGKSGIKRLHTYSNEEVFVENSFLARAGIKKRILKQSLLEYKCNVCKNTGSYNNLPLVLHLDHINGIHNDHRLINLRFLCPNCHSQSDTYAGKRKAYKTGS